MSISRPVLNSRIALALFGLVVSCTRAPESYPPPLQVVMPSGPEPPATMPAGRLVLAMSDPDASAHIRRDVYTAPDNAEWRFTGLHPAFRFDVDERQNLDFYVRFLVTANSLLARGPVDFAVEINGHRFRSYRFSYAGDTEYSHPVPDDWIARPGPIDISLDVDPPWRLPDRTIYGLYLNCIGFARRSK